MSELLELVHQLNRNTLGWGAIVVLLLSCIQIAPIKINPWSFIGKHIGRALNSELFSKIDRISTAFDQLEDKLSELENKVEHMDHKNDEDRAITARVRILRFNDELLAKKPHSKETFDQALEDVDVYEKYCAAHPEFKNNKTIMSVRNIKKTYQKRLDKHDFLINGLDD